MADTFHIQVASPEKLLVETDAVSAQIPAKDGYIGVLPSHAALLSELGSGKLSYVAAAGQENSLEINGGYLEILDDQVRILTEKT